LKRKWKKVRVIDLQIVIAQLSELKADIYDLQLDVNKVRLAIARVEKRM
jgi:hypothetical protein